VIGHAGLHSSFGHSAAFDVRTKILLSARGRLGLKILLSPHRGALTKRDPVARDPSQIRDHLFFFMSTRLATYCVLIGLETVHPFNSFRWRTLGLCV